eukprot:4468642-Pyramimonas_sp.AAC.1
MAWTSSRSATLTGRSWNDPERRALRLATFSRVAPRQQRAARAAPSRRADEWHTTKGSLCALMADAHVPAFDRTA